VRSDSSIDATVMVLCASDDTLPISIPNTLRIFTYRGLDLISVVPMPFTVMANTVYRVSVTVAGRTLTVAINGTQVFSGSVSVMPANGCFGFANSQGALSRATDLTVTSSAGTILLSEKLRGPQTPAFIDACIAGTNVTPSIMDGATRDREVWSGDCGISTLTVLCGTFENQYVSGSCEQFFLYQNSDGSIPNAVPAQAKGPTLTGSLGSGAQDYTMMQLSSR
jgi:alpha-L-rhamnosidase